MLKKGISLIIALLCGVALFLAGVFIVPRPIATAADGPDDSFARITFKSFGISDGEYTQSDSSNATGNFMGNLDKKYFTGNIKLSDNNAKFYIGGTEPGKGLGFTINGVRLQATFNGSNVKSFLRNKAGLSSFVNTEFTLGISFEVSGSDLNVGVYFNGNLYDNSVILIENGAVNLGTALSLVCNDKNSKITVVSDNSIRALPNKEFNWITTDHFYIEDGTYGYTDGTVAVKGTYPLNLDRTYFTANVTFSEIEGASIRYGGQEKSGGLTGFVISLSNGDLLISDAVTGYTEPISVKATDVDLTSFVNTEFKLGISVEVIDADSDGKHDDIQVGIWVNDILCKEEYLNFLNYSNKIGSTLGVISTVEGSTVKIGKISELSVTMPDPTLKKITPSEHFNMADGVYSGFNPSEAYTKGFDNTYFSAYLTYKPNANFYILSDDTGWAGISFGYDGTNLIVKTTGNGAIIKTLTPTIAGVDFSKKFRIGIATTFIDADNDGNKNDVKLGVYFNEDLYNDEFFVIKDYLNGSNFNKITAYAPSTSVVVGSIAEFKDEVTSRPIDSSLKKISFESAAIEDGLYEYNSASPAALAALGAYSKSFKGVAFSGSVEFSSVNSDNSSAQITFANSDGWAGLRCKISSAGDFYIDEASNKQPTMVFKAKQAGLENFSTEFNLGLTFKIVDSDSDGEEDDVEFGVWFNDVLYKDEYFYLVDYASSIGKNVGIYCPKNTWVKVGTRADFIPEVVPEQVGSQYTLITLSHFGVPNTTYETEGLVARGAYLKSLDNTYFTYNTTYIGDKLNANFIYAGQGDGWTGLGITVSEKQIAVRDTAGRTDTYYFTAKGANVDSFINKEMKIGVTTDYVDLDGDGAEDDVKFGLWINDYLCNNEYIELIDYRQYVGNEKEGIGAGLGIYIPKLGGGKLQVASSFDIPVDIERFGFTMNWARELALYANTTTTNPSTRPTQSPQTGDSAKMLNAMIFSCVALGGIMNIEKKRR